MRTTLRTDITIDQICKGFVYNELEGKGLFGLSGKLVIQPEYQCRREKRHSGYRISSARIPAWFNIFQSNRRRQI